MHDITMNDKEQSTFKQTMDYVNEWCSEHQWEIGAAEMAVGASIIALGIQGGAIEMGKDVVATAFSNFNIGEGIGGAVGSGIGGVGGAVLGSIGVAAMGTAIGIPAILVIGGGSVILGAAGYAVGDLTHKFLNPAVDPGQFFKGASMLVVGTALLIDGARRVIKDKRVLDALSCFKDGVIHLTQVSVNVVAQSLDEMKKFMSELTSIPNSPIDVTGSAVAGTGLAVAGVAAGSAVATTGVTVMGSQALGGIALSLGLVSAPVWPLIAGGAAGLAIGYAGWKTCKFWGGKYIRNK